ncbi:MAG: XdhC family protein [Fidelibacterota bacterium]
MPAEAEFYRRAGELLSEGRSFITAEVIEVRGSSPGEVGAKMIIHLGGETEFTIGGGAFEAEVIKDSLNLLREKARNRIKKYEFTEEKLGMYCTGSVRVLMEVHSPPPHLVIFGGGHIGQALGNIAYHTGLFRITVIDDREEYANSRVHPNIKEIILTDKDYSSNIPHIGDNSYVVIATRCHDTDRKVLKMVLANECPYVGMVGSMSKREKLIRQLMDEGVDPEALDGIHTPVGLPIGGKSPGEIAVSILAEIIKLINEKRG